MKRLFIFLLVFNAALPAFADHITGGTIYYTFLDSTGGKYRYQVTLLLYRDHFSTGAQLDPSATIAVFDKGTNQRVWMGSTAVDTFQLHLGNPSPCILKPPTIWYDVGRYTYIITVNSNKSGYIIAFQRCCRIAGINNLINSNTVGATYTAEIPGTASSADAMTNNSAKFVGIDTVVICAYNSFCYNFGASDPDKSDSLSYSFCDAYTGGTTTNAAPIPPAAPPYQSVPYAAPYSAGSPLGPGVKLDPHTGMMCGIAPSPGIYVVTVCVNEYRKGVLIATQRKDLQIKIGDCNIARAQLLPAYPTCDGFTRTFSNEAPPNPAIHSYFWDFGVSSSSNDTSVSATPTFTYPDTGIYVLTLIVNKGEQCADTAQSIVKVYPGFFPNFTFNGICVDKPTQFLDSTKTAYGFVNTWNWNFGDAASQSNTSSVQNPTYTYAKTGIYHIRFIVGTNKGCIDTLYKDIAIRDKPPLSVAFKDTLICRGDALPLHASGKGNFSWTPLINIVNPNTPTPTVSPTSTQTYAVQLEDEGCINNDSVRVRVVTVVTLQAKPDTLICLTDSVQLFAVSDGLRFQWSPAADFSNSAAQNPFVRPQGTSNKYTVTAIIGSCNATSTVTVKAVPYPIADAGSDTTICYSASAQLHGKIVGSSFSWSPTNTLTNFNTLDPIATPRQDSSLYVLTVHDTLGCPKPGFDTVLVFRLPKIYPYAGNDTSVIAGQPLQFNATGGTSYTWIPSIGLNNPNIHNPIGRYDGSFEYVTYRVIVRDIAGCADSAFIKVRIFRTVPQVFVPTAFTPNGDGRNDVFRPIAVGIDKILYFRVFNRWGQLVFETTENGKGWDGRINGKEQATGVFVWVVKAVDYLGKDFFAKGTTTLIR